MKRIIALIAVVFTLSLTNSTQAQTLIWSNGLALDTVDNTETHYASVLVGNTATKAFSIVVKVTKISGTVGGTISYQGSNDGVTYVTVATDTATDATANYSYEIYTPHAFRYYRVSWTGTGTMKASVSGAAFQLR